MSVERYRLELQIFSHASRSLAVIAISGYQKFLSPHKGFSCAHRVLYGCDSCSQYFKRVIAEEGIMTAIANAKGRFQECRDANEILKKRKEKCSANRKYYASRDYASRAIAKIELGESGDLELPEDADSPEEAANADKKKLGGSQWGRKTRSQANNGTTDSCNDCGNCADALSFIPSDCPELSCPDLGCGNADCLSGMDCSGLDLGGLDCSGCGDCGSCG